MNNKPNFIESLFEGIYRTIVVLGALYGFFVLLIKFLGALQTNYPTIYPVITPLIGFYFLLLAFDILDFKGQAKAKEKDRQVQLLKDGRYYEIQNLKDNGDWLLDTDLNLRFGKLKQEHLEQWNNYKENQRRDRINKAIAEGVKQELESEEINYDK